MKNTSQIQVLRNQAESILMTTDKKYPVNKGQPFAITQYNSAFKTVNTKKFVAVVAPAILCTPLKVPGKITNNQNIDKVKLPNINAVKPGSKKDRISRLQHFEDSGVSVGGSELKKQITQICVYGSKRALSSNDTSNGSRSGIVIQGKSGYGAGSPLSIIMEKRKMLNKKPAVKKPCESKQAIRLQPTTLVPTEPLNKQCKTPDINPPLEKLKPLSNASEVSPLKIIEELHESKTQDMNDASPLNAPAAGEDAELQKLKEADGLRHFMWPITPLNLEEEEAAFFRNNCKTNPQFTYHKPKLATRILKSFKKPDGNLLPLAIKVLDAFMKTYGSESNFLATDGGELLSLAETKEIFQKYIDDLKLTPYLKLDFSYNTVSPTTISHDPKTGQSIITIGLPIAYRKNRIMGVINHEIGTHFLRNFNDQFQPWSHARRKNKLKNYLNTEEGLASLNQLFHIVF